MSPDVINFSTDLTTCIMTCKRCTVSVIVPIDLKLPLRDSYAAYCPKRLAFDRDHLNCKVPHG